MNVAEICEAFGLGAPTAGPSYVARGELGRVSQLTTETGVWAVKEIELFVPTIEEADANVELQEAMLDAGLSLPRPQRTTGGHGLFGNVRVYEWLDQANLIDFHCRRALDSAATPETRARAELALRALLARPLTRRLIDEVCRLRSE